MLNKRFKNDRKPFLKLNDLQLEMKAKVEQKVEDKTYPFHELPCAICYNNQFEQIAEKDRYGLYMSVVICTHCGLVQTNPRMSDEAYQSFYNKEYRKLYVGSVDPTEAFFKMQYERGKSIYQYLTSHQIIQKLPTDAFILEVGCGAGGILKYFKECGYTVKGVDPGIRYINYGKEKGLNLEVGFLADIQLEKQADLIIYSHVAEHILDLNKEMNQAYQTLSDQGVLYVEVPGIRYLSHNYRSNFLLYLQNAHTYHFSLETLCQIVEKNGFELVTGNQMVKSIFTKQLQPKDGSTLINDYTKTMAYLKKLESGRQRIPFYHYFVNPSLISFDLKLAILRLLDSLGLRKYLRKSTSGRNYVSDKKH